MKGREQIRLKEKLGTEKQVQNNLTKKARNDRGITLIALVVTIIVLLILAGVTITAVLGEDGIIERAQEAAEKTKNAVDRESEDFEKLNSLLSEYGGGTGGESTPPPDEEQDQDSLKADGSFYGNVNTPKLGTGMTAIKWDESSKTWDEENVTNANWYNYSSQGTDTNHWANAKTADGSMWVWIPRFAYKITEGYHTGGSSAKGKIDVKFLHGTGNNYTTSGTQTAEAKTSVTADATTSTAVTDYVVHPAFEWNGEQISGIWVAKFEASRTGASPTEDGTGDPLKVVPGVRSWTNIKISEIYDKCEKYNEDLDSHLMKNSEWGAVAYLAQSQYGLNSGNTGVYKEIGVNECSDKITGAGPGGTADVASDSYSYNTVSTSFESTYGYTGTQGVKASTTGNVYGVYDMSGGSWEYVAAYVDNGHGNIGEYGGSLKTASKSKSYTVDVYESASTNGSSTASTDYDKAKSKYGDAVYETSSSAGDSNSWYGDYSYFPNSSLPFFIRGGLCNSGSNAGLFFFGGNNGNGHSNYSFRPVLLAR